MGKEKVCLISLGCSKNVIDSEHMKAYIRNSGMEIVPSVADADIAVINTCAFIEDAKKEAIETILDAARFKTEGNLKSLIVAGCLAQRYRDEILTELPEIDAVVGTGSYHEIADVIKRLCAGETKPTAFSDINCAPIGGKRIVSTPKHTAYIKIAEGCDNHCAFCVIPSLRGRYRSRSIEEIVQEAEELAANGVKELILIAQDVSRYGKDLYGERKLCELLEKLCGISGIEWIRLHYLYPDEIDDKLLNLIAGEEKILNYFDIPIQHISSRLLRSMNRRGDKTAILSLLKKIRDIMPDAVIRTSIIAGLPGESEAEFEELCEFLQKQKLPRVGVFAYSKEEGTAAARMPYYLQIDSDAKQRRKDIIDNLQAQIMEEYNQSKIGSVETVLVEGISEENGLYYGRTYADSPEVDGTVYFKSAVRIDIGQFVKVKITEIIDFDLAGERIS